jgi:hypothetical protein
MSNRIYTLKLAEAHLNAITSALSQFPWKEVAPIMASIGSQVQAQRKDEAELPLEAAE